MGNIGQNLRNKSRILFEGINAISNVDAIKLLNTLLKRPLGVSGAEKYMKPLGFYKTKRAKYYPNDNQSGYGHHRVVWWVRG